MILWVDAQLPPAIARWITGTFGIDAAAVRDLGLRDAKDFQIFQAARSADAVILTKDVDFQNLLARHGAPPRILWLTCGNTSNAELRRILSSTLQSAIALLEAGESLVEISGKPGGTGNDDGSSQSVPHDEAPDARNGGSP